MNNLNIEGTTIPKWIGPSNISVSRANDKLQVPSIDSPQIRQDAIEERDLNKLN